MTEPEKEKFDKMEDNVGQITNDMAQLKSDMIVIKSALVGNSFSGEKGLTGRFDIMSMRQDDFDTRIKHLEKKDITNDVYIKIMLGISSATISGLILLLIDMFKK